MSGTSLALIASSASSGLPSSNSHGGEPRACLRLIDAREPLRHLILEQSRGAVQQIDLHQPIGQGGDHLVAVGATGRQLAELVVSATAVSGAN